ncbi:MAG: DUF5060 domain-containing protein [Planctomycetota bacterium]
MQRFAWIGGFVGLLASSAAVAQVDRSVVFEEVDGLVAVEAEHFSKQDTNDFRAWYPTTTQKTPDVGRDDDPNHADGASGNAYLEALPDTRKNHSEKLIQGENFFPQPGMQGVLHYKVHFNNPGRYYVWARIYSTGSEDNGLHVGLNGEWPESGQRLQWCDGKHSWRWESRQRTAEKHCGVPGLIYLDIEEPGNHVISFSMREDGAEFDRWLMTTDPDFPRPEGAGPPTRLKSGTLPEPPPAMAPKPRGPALADVERLPDGDGAVTVDGDLMQWHAVSVDVDGPFAHELDNGPNPFRDYNMTVTFEHADGGRSYAVPGYFAADGDAANSGADSGTVWRAKFSPDRPGRWDYTVSFLAGEDAAIGGDAQPLLPFDGQSGSFEVAATDKAGPDFRGRGRLIYVGDRYLRTAGDGEVFLKAGADAPETLLGYTEFDGTETHRQKLKTWEAHAGDWNPGDPTWGDDERGKGLIGAVNYLADAGGNAFSFLTYNAGGDGDNVWPFVERSDPFHYDVSKLDQWGVVFDHGNALGMYLHFKLQETENDDLNTKREAGAQHALDRGKLGPERKLYLREMIARYGHLLALNWNLGEENTQPAAQQRAMAEYIRELDPYDHHMVIHSYPNQQDKVYRPLLGDQSELTGASLQNSHVNRVHEHTLKWVKASEEAGRPWVVAFDEAGNAQIGSVPPDPGFQGFNPADSFVTIDDTRKYVLWGNLMAGGGGVEYYFGYQLPQNDLNADDWRSRHRTWGYAGRAIELMSSLDLPLPEMKPMPQLVGNPPEGNEAYCLAKPGEVYLVYLPNGGERSLDLGDDSGSFSLEWHNPREDAPAIAGDPVSGGAMVDLRAPNGEDWLAVIRRQ